MGFCELLHWVVVGADGPEGVFDFIGNGDTGNWLLVQDFMELLGEVRSEH